MKSRKIILTEEFKSIHDFWSPRILAEVNDQFLKIAKVKGDIVWHQHAHEDELFLIIKGELTLQFKDREDIHLKEGECYVVPRGVLHRPVAENECQILLIESKSTQHTGDQVTSQTKSIEDQLQKQG